MEIDGRMVLDRVFTLLVILLALLAFTPILWILGSVFVNGVKAFTREGLSVLFKTPSSPISSSLGGIGPALLGTLVLIVLTTIIGLPVAFFTAVLATEYPHTLLARIVNVLVRSLLGLPTILVGMLVYTLIVIPMGRFSAIAGAIALAIILLPYTYTYVENALNTIPRDYREAAYSIGLTKAGALLRVFIGIARRGIVAGILVGLSRACGETAPLLFTIGGSSRIYFTGLDQPIDAIPLLVYRYALTPYENYHTLAWCGALVLTLIYLTIFLTARIVVRGVEVD